MNGLEAAATLGDSNLAASFWCQKEGKGEIVREDKKGKEKGRLTFSSLSFSSSCPRKKKKKKKESERDVSSREEISSNLVVQVLCVKMTKGDSSLGRRRTATSLGLLLAALVSSVSAEAFAKSGKSKLRSNVKKWPNPLHVRA